MIPTARRLALFLTAAAATTLAGCASPENRPKPLRPDAFSAQPPATSGNPGAAAGGTGPEDAGQSPQPAVRIPLNGNTRPEPANPTGPRSEIEPKTTNNGQLPAPSSSNGTTDNGQPQATRPTVGASSGQFLTLGGVVAEVNGSPIYANKVLAPLDPIFRTRAKQMDLNKFRLAAADDIRRQILATVIDELEYASAQRSLDAEDKRKAEIATMGFRMRLITNAGGSLEVARRKVQQDYGISLEEYVEERSRHELGNIFYQKKIFPLIQVTANDIRAYYDKNIDQYTANEKVRFRVLKVDIRKSGGPDAAVNKINDKLKRAKAGEDFEQMVLKENNDDPIFAKSDLGEMSPASFAIAPIRDVLAKLRPGDISDPLRDNNAYYLVQLVDRKPGRVRPFEEQVAPEAKQFAVQEEIKQILQREQYRTLRERHRQQLLASAILRPSMPVLFGQQPPSTPQEAQMLNTALEMALQRYAEYASAK
jgi:parvulin-like peptidyl-prolyl isomerase